MAMGFKPCQEILTLIILICLSFVLQITNGETYHHTFVVHSSPYSRLCSTKNILTVNGKFPGPTLKAHRGDKLIINFINKAEYNVTLHWHGVRQPRNPWSDGAEYINQCPIRPGKKFRYTIDLTTEEGTIWWHAHSGWARATLHGMIIVYPNRGATYPFPKPFAEVPIILGEWWKKNVMDIERNANKTGAEPILSDAFTINGQPGDLHPCSKQDTFRMEVEHGKTYLLRIVNAVMDENIFFAIDRHKLTLVGTDGFYTKPFETNYIMITPGQSMDVLLTSNQPTGSYYLAARSYTSANGSGFDRTTTTGILHYPGARSNSGPLLLPPLPPFNATPASTAFSRRMRSLVSKDHPIDVPIDIDTRLLITVSVNLLNCTGEPCTGPFGKRFSASLNNVSLVYPRTDVLQAYYHHIKGVYGTDFPKMPPRRFDYTGKSLPEDLFTPDFGTKAIVLKYNASVEMVLQGTNVLSSNNHPMHLHGYGFYVVGWGFGNFDLKKDRSGYNLVDPPQETTVGIPNNGWVAIRFRADNPGVWLLHCHLERHQSWGMSTVVLVKNGHTRQSKILRPPRDVPSC